MTCMRCQLRFPQALCVRSLTRLTCLRASSRPLQVCTCANKGDRMVTVWWFPMKTTSQEPAAGDPWTPLRAPGPTSGADPSGIIFTIFAMLCPLLTITSRGVFPSDPGLTDARGQGLRCSAGETCMWRCIWFASESPVCASKRPHGARSWLKGEITGEIR